MRLKVMSIALLLCAATYAAHATGNTLTLSGGNGRPSEEVTVTAAVQFANPVTAFQVVMPLDKNLKYVDKSSILDRTLVKDHIIEASGANGELRIYVYSPTLKPIKGNGNILTFKFRLGREPGIYNLNPQVKLSNASGTAAGVVANGCPVTVLTPKIEISSPVVDWGRVPIRGTYTNTLTITNSGTEPLAVTDINCENADFSFSEKNITVSPGSSYPVTVTYKPLVRGSVSANVTITSNAINRQPKVTFKATPFSVNELHVQHAEGISDTQVEVALRMNNMEPITALQCEFTLPDALRFVDGSFATTYKGMETVATVKGDRLKLYMYSPTLSTIGEQDGIVATFKLLLSGNSGWYNLTPENVILSNVGSENMTSATSGEYVVIQSPQINGSEALTIAESPLTEVAKGTYSFHNYGQAALVINKVEFLNTGYSVTTPMPLVVKPYETGELIVEYRSNVEEKYTTTMQVYSNDPTCRVKSVKVDGNMFEPNSLVLALNGNKMEIDLENYSDVTAMQFDISTAMPSQLNAAWGGKLSAHSNSCTKIAENLYRVAIFSMNNSLIGKKGNLLTLEGIGDNKLDNVNISNIKLSYPNGGLVSHCKVVKKNITKVSSIVLDKKEISLYAGETAVINATVTPDSAVDKGISWKSSNNGVAIVENGTVRSVAIGSAVITASAIDGSGVTATANVTVKAKLGDVNYDNEIAVNDIVLVVENILGASSEAFHFDTADANQDGRITINDVAIITNLILNP